MVASFHALTCGHIRLLGVARPFEAFVGEHLWLAARRDGCAYAEMATTRVGGRADALAANCPNRPVQFISS
jgi:hypothetical protein